MTTTEIVLQVVRDVLTKHLRSDWSDRTYACQGCKDDADAALQQRLQTHPDDWHEAREQYVLATKPDWTMEQYIEHVVEEVNTALRQAEDEHEPLYALDLLVRTHNALFKAHVLTIADLRRLLADLEQGTRDLPRGVGAKGLSEMKSELARWDARRM